MTEFTPRQVRLFGDEKRSGAMAGLAYKLLFRLKAFMRHRGLLVAGPFVWSGPGWQIVCKSINGVRDYVDIYTAGAAVSGEKHRILAVDKMLLFWGDGYERIDFTYADESALFLPGNVECSDGAGSAELVIGGRLVGMFTRCWTAGGGVSQPLNKADGIITSCRREWFADTYTTRELFAGFDFSTNADNVLSPSDELNISCRMNAGNKAFSKTVGKLTVEAFEYGDRSYSLGWALCAKYAGKQVLFPDGSPSFTASDFKRTELYFQGIYIRLQTFEILFDCWEENGSLYMGACGQNVMRIWQIFEDGGCAAVLTRTLVGKVFEPPASTPANYRPYVCGYAKRTAFINRGGYGIVLESGTGVSGSNGTAKVIEKTLWNPFDEKLYYWEDGRETIVHPDYAYAALVDRCESSGYTGVWCHCGCGDTDSCAQYPLPCPCTAGDQYVHTYDYQVTPTLSTSITVSITWGWIFGASVDCYITTHYTVHVYKQVRTTYGEYNIQAVGLDGKPNSFAKFSCGEYILTTGSWYQYSGLNWIASYSGPLLCKCYTSRTGYSLDDWNVMPEGVAYRVSSEKIDTCAGFGGGCDGEDDTLSGGEHGTLYLTFDEWEAYLKSGVDGRGEALDAPAYCFRQPTSGNIFMFHGEELTMNILGTGDRVFFQYVEHIRETK